jgi:hypothetical protein
MEIGVEYINAINSGLIVCRGAHMDALKIGSQNLIKTANYFHNIWWGGG